MKMQEKSTKSAVRHDFVKWFVNCGRIEENIAVTSERAAACVRGNLFSGQGSREKSRSEIIAVAD